MRGITAIATKVNTAAEILPVLSVLKFNSPIASPPRTTVKLSHERNVRSLAKKTTSAGDPIIDLVCSRYLLVRLGPGGQFVSLGRLEIGIEEMMIPGCV